jgi:hypothetical protein
VRPAQCDRFRHRSDVVACRRSAISRNPPPTRALMKKSQQQARRRTSRHLIGASRSPIAQRVASLRCHKSAAIEADMIRASGACRFDKKWPEPDLALNQVTDDKARPAVFQLPIEVNRWEDEVPSVRFMNCKTLMRNG